MMIRRLSPVMLLFWAAFAAWGQNAAWQATLEPAQPAATYAPTETLQLDFPHKLDARARSQLALEMDAIDVTALADAHDSGMSYTPLQALAVGSHQLRLVSYDDRGAMQVHGSWTFNVAAAAVPTTSSGAASTPTHPPTRLRADLALSGSERVADHALSQPVPARFSTDGSAALGMQTQGDRWSTTTEVDLTEAGPAATATAVNPGVPGSSQAALQLGQFSFAAQSENVHLVAGDQSLPYNGLVVSQLSRRGLSGRAKVKPLHADIGVFSVRSDVISGFSHGLGVGDRDHRVSGGLFDWHPLANPEALDLALAYAGGRGAPYGLASYSTPLQTTPAGNAYGIDLDSQLWQRQVHLHGAVARSTYDFGTPGLPRRADSARNLSLSYQPASTSNASGAPGVSSVTSLSYQSTGTYFRSLANPGVTPDMRQWQLSQSLGGSIWSLQGNVGLDADNVDHNALITTVYTRRLQLAASVFPTSSGSPGWLGTPYYSLSLDASHSRNGARAKSTDPRTDLFISSINASAQFSHTRWNWNLGVMLGRTTDHTGQQDSNRVFGPTLGANLTLGQSGSIGFALQYTDTYDRVLFTHDRNASYNLFASGDLVSGVLNGQLNYSITHTAQAVSQFMGTPQPGMSYDTRTLNGSLLWHALPVHTNRVGLDVSLSGLWNHGGYPTVAGMPMLPADTYQVFLKVSLVMPLRHPGDTP